jgi:HAE1 family hydrophobic/amphiphilic exporter-1
VRLFGDSPALLESLVERLEERFAGIPGTAGIERDDAETVAEVRLRPDEEMLGRYELSSAALARRIEATFAGSRLREIRTATGEMPLRVKIAEEETDSLRELEDLDVRVDGGAAVPLSILGTFEEGTGPEERRREERRASVSFAVNLEPDAQARVEPVVERALAGFDWPAGYSYDLGAQWRGRTENEAQLTEGLLLAIFLVYGVMACLFESLRQPLALMITVLCAVPGVVWFLYLHGDAFDQPAGVGMILLAGIVVNNGIVYLDQVNRYSRTGSSLPEALRLGGEDRLRPILITALTTLIGLLPMAYGGAQAAGTYYFTLARTIIGGLLVSTLLTLVVLPVVVSYLMAARSPGRAIP